MTNRNRHRSHRRGLINFIEIQPRCTHPSTATGECCPADFCSRPYTGHVERDKHKGTAKSEDLRSYLAGSYSDNPGQVNVHSYVQNRTRRDRNATTQILGRKFGRYICRSDFPAIFEVTNYHYSAGQLDGEPMIILKRPGSLKSAYPNISRIQCPLIHLSLLAWTG
jgi:hypothetical protein